MKTNDRRPIFIAIQNDQQAFNGYGGQETCDMLFQALLSPCIPASEVCRCEEAFQQLKNALQSYQLGRQNCLHTMHFPSVSGDTAFHMHHDGHSRFLRTVTCYKRRFVSVNDATLQAMHSRQLLSSGMLQASGYALGE